MNEFAVENKFSPSKLCVSTLFSAMVKAGFIYLVSLRWPVAMEASGSSEGSMMLIMRCTATLRSCDICYQPSGRETRHLFIGLIPLPIPPLYLTLLCTLSPSCVCTACMCKC